MSTYSDISLPLSPGEFYHIYNRGNEKRLIFFERGHYFRFLQKLTEYMKGYVDFYTKISTTQVGEGAVLYRRSMMAYIPTTGPFLSQLNDTDFRKIRGKVFDH